MKPTFENEDQVRKEMGAENFKIINDITKKIVGDMKPLDLRGITEAQIDNIFERSRSIEEVFESTGSAVYDLKVVIKKGEKAKRVFVNHFTNNLAVLSLLENTGERFQTTYVGCYKRDEKKYVFFEPALVVPLDEESKPYYQKAIAIAKEIFPE